MQFLQVSGKDHPIRLGVPASEQSILDKFQHSKISSLPKIWKKATYLKLFMKTRCHETHCMFQVKKCADSACYYCGKHPARLPRDIFTGLQFVPLPLLNSSKDHYKKFSDRYGEIPSDKDRPSPYLQ